MATVDIFVDSHTDDAKGALGGLSDILGGALSVATGEIAVQAFEALTGAMGDLLGQAMDSEKQQAGLAAVIKSTGGAAGLTQDAVNQLAQQFKGLAGGSDEAIVSIEEVGIRSGQINADAMPQFIKNVTDLGTVMGDTGAAATLLARAQDDPEAAFKRIERSTGAYDVALQAQIKSMVKAGDTAGATALVMQFVADKTGGAAAAAADTMSGRWEIMNNELQDAGKGILTAVLPAMESLFDNVLKPAIPVVETIAAAFADFLGTFAGGDFEDPIGNLANLVYAVANALGLDGKGLFSAVENLREPFENFMAALPGAASAVQEFFAAIQSALGGDTTKLGETLKSWGQQLIAWIGPMIPPLLVELGKLYIALATWELQQIAGIAAQLLLWGQEFIAWVGPQIPPLLAKLGELANQLLAWLAAQVPPLIAQLLKWGQEFIAWVAPQVGPLLAQLGLMLGQMVAWIITTGVPGLVDKIKEWSTAFMDWVMKPGGAKDQILPALSKFLLAVGDFVVNTMVPGFVGFAKSFIDGLLSGFNTNLPDFLAKMQGIGSSIVSKIVDGINAAPGAILAALSTIVNNAIASIIGGLTGGGGGGGGGGGSSNQSYSNSYTTNTFNFGGGSTDVSVNMATVRALTGAY